jgi:hypothetical protein
MPTASTTTTAAKAKPKAKVKKEMTVAKRGAKSESKGVAGGPANKEG